MYFLNKNLPQQHEIYHILHDFHCENYTQRGKLSQSSNFDKLYTSILNSNADQHNVYMSHLVEKPTWFSNRSDTNRPVQAQKMARSLKFRI